MSANSETSVGFGTVCTPNLDRYPQMNGRRHVIVEITVKGGNYNFEVSTIWDDTPGEEKLGSPGSAGLQDISEFTSQRWTVEQVLKGYMNGFLKRADGKSPPESRFRTGLETRAAQPDIIITR